VRTGATEPATPRSRFSVAGRPSTAPTRSAAAASDHPVHDTHPSVPRQCRLGDRKKTGRGPRSRRLTHFHLESCRQDRGSDGTRIGFIRRHSPVTSRLSASGVNLVVAGILGNAGMQNESRRFGSGGEGGVWRGGTHSHRGMGSEERPRLPPWKK